MEESQFYFLEDIESLEYKNGFFDIPFFVIDILSDTRGFRGNTKPDQLHLYYKNGNIKIIYRFGKKKDFINTVKIIENQLESNCYQYS